MQAFNNIALPDAYGSGANKGEFLSDKGVACFVSIFNNPAAFQVVQRDPGRTSDLVPLPEQASAPGSFLVEGAAGIKMRNNVAGSVARVFVTVYEPTDPRIAGFNPTTITVTASGATSSAAVAELAYNEFTADVGVAAVTEATANALVTASAITMDGVTKIYIEFFAPSWLSAIFQGRLTLVLYEDGASIGLLGGFDYSDSSASNIPFTALHVARRFTPLSGNHTYSIRAFTNVGATVKAGSGGSGFFVPGFIRISQVG